MLPAASEVSDLAVCGSRWYAVGSRVTTGTEDSGPDAARAPAAWSSADGRTWSAVPIVPRSVYGKVSRLYAVACGAALGAANGGVHGNPRTAAWTLSLGSYRELAAPFELFGGPSALSVDRIATGPGGWLITGGWLTSGRGGAAAWKGPVLGPNTSPGTLASSPGEQTVAGDAVALGSGWLIGGSTTVLADARREPLAWRSTPTGWVRERLPGSGNDAGVDRLAADGTAVLAAGTGLDAGHFVLWRRGADGIWAAPITIGSISSGATAVPAVRALATSGRNIAVAAGDGSRLRLWLSTDAGARWRELALPSGAPVADNGEARLAVAISGDELVVAVGSGDRGRLWSAKM